MSSAQGTAPDGKTPIAAAVATRSQGSVVRTASGARPPRITERSRTGAPTRAVPEAALGDTEDPPVERPEHRGGAGGRDLAATSRGLRRCVRWRRHGVRLGRVLRISLVRSGSVRGRRPALRAGRPRHPTVRSRGAGLRHAPGWPARRLGESGPTGTAIDDTGRAYGLTPRRTAGCSPSPTPSRRSVRCDEYD